MDNMDSESSRPIHLEGDFTVQGKQCHVTFNGQLLKWQNLNGKKKDEVVIPIGEILSVSNSTNDTASGDLHLVYFKHKKYNIVRTKETLHGTPELRSQFMAAIQEQIKNYAGRPRRCLVLINPISGFKKGEREYEQKVAPLFSEAGIITHVIVTKSADHVREILASFDLTSIDSIVVVGGDGIFHLMLNALLRRLTSDAGLDINDPNIDLPDLPLNVGIIPCGTGNGMATASYGTRDTVTAAASIIIGDTQAKNICGIWSGGEFVVFTTMMKGAGLLLDLIYQTEARRNLGVWRYPVVMGKYMFTGSVPSMDVTLQYKSPTITATEPNNNPPPSSSLDAKSTSDGEWRTWSGSCVSVFAVVFDLFGYRVSKSDVCVDHGRCLIMKDWSRLSYIKFVASLMTYSPSILSNPNYEHIIFSEYKVKITNAEQLDRRSHMVNVDGEVVRLKHPEFHVKVYPRKVKLFGRLSPEDMLNLL